MLRKNIAIFTMVYALILTGCATLGTYNPATGTKDFILISTSSELSMGRSVHVDIQEEYKLSEDIDKLERLRNIGQRVAFVSDRQDYEYKFYLIEDDGLNAFTAPGGYIYCFTELYDRLDDDELAGVLAHEIGHCAARHVVKRIQATMGYNLIAQLVFGKVSASESDKRNAAMISNAVMGLVMKGYSREDEYKADALSVKYVHGAGFDPEGIVGTLELLKKEAKGPQGPLILRSHPYLQDRIIRVKALISLLRNE